MHFSYDRCPDILPKPKGAFVVDELVDVLLEVVEVDAGLLGLLGWEVVVAAAAAGAACDLYKIQNNLA